MRPEKSQQKSDYIPPFTKEPVTPSPRLTRKGEETQQTENTAHSGPIYATINKETPPAKPPRLINVTQNESVTPSRNNRHSEHSDIEEPIYYTIREASEKSHQSINVTPNEPRTPSPSELITKFKEIQNELNKYVEYKKEKIKKESLLEKGTRIFLKENNLTKATELQKDVDKFLLDITKEKNDSAFYKKTIEFLSEINKKNDEFIERTDRLFRKKGEFDKTIKSIKKKVSEIDAAANDAITTHKEEKSDAPPPLPKRSLKS